MLREQTMTEQRGRLGDHKVRRVGYGAMQLAEGTPPAREDGIGLSGVGMAEFRRALPAGVACVQNLYNLLDRTAEPLLAECAAHGVAWVPFFPLGSAIPEAPRVAEHPAVAAAAADLGVTPA